MPDGGSSLDAKGTKKGPEEMIRAFLVRASSSELLKHYRCAAFSTVRVTVAVWVFPPPVPVMVMVWAPVVA